MYWENMNQTMNAKCCYRELYFFKRSKRLEPQGGVRRPGLEPGFRRWQRLVITTTLSAQDALLRFYWWEFKE